MSEMPKSVGGRPAETRNTAVTSLPKEQTLSEIGFSKWQASRFEALAAHPEIVAQAKAEARENACRCLT